MTAHILVVDVEHAARKQTISALAQADYALAVKPSFREALLHLKQYGQSVDLILMAMPQDVSDGLNFIAEVSNMGLDLPIIAQMGQGNLADVAEVMRAGAFDFMVRPVSRERLNGAVKAALKVARSGKNRVSRRSRSHQLQFSSIISASQSMMRVVSLARKAAHNHIPIVLEGETGVGKMLMARAIHSASDRSSKPFVVVDCAAFASASDVADSSGEDHLSLWRAKIAEAEGATLYFNEVGDLPARFQSKLLELAQAGHSLGPRISPNNGRGAARIISSSSKDLIEEVRSRRFRDDLYYRLNVFPIAIAPLRRRQEDIPHLVRMFTEYFSSEQRKTRVPSISAGAMALLTGFDWPGNIRQLENALYRAVTLSEHDELTEVDFPQIMAQLQPAAHQISGILGPELIISNMAASYSDIGKGAARDQGGERAVKVNSLQNNSADKGAISSINDEGELRPLAEIEEELIRFALRFYRGQMSQVARKLGIGRSTLYRKLKDYGIDPDDPLRDAA